MENNKYHSYLASEEWQELREDVLDRARNRCELCNRDAEHIHHIKYPKYFKDDNINNLLAVCNICHRKLHGVDVILNHEKLFHSLLASLRSYLTKGDNLKALPELKEIHNDYVRIIRGE